MKFNTKPMRVPYDFDYFLGRLQDQLREQTGLPYSKTATMRQLSKCPLIVQKGNITWKIL